MRTTDTGEFGDNFFKVFSRHPGEISLTLKSGETVSGDKWKLFARYLTLDGRGIGDIRLAEVGYSNIKTYTAEVDLGSPFGQYFTHPSSDPDWSDWEEHHRLAWFIERLRAEDIVKLVIGKGTIPDGMTTLVRGRIESLTDSDITLVGSIRLPRAEVGWVCQYKSA